MTLKKKIKEISGTILVCLATLSIMLLCGVIIVNSVVASLENMPNEFTVIKKESPTIHEYILGIDVSSCIEYRMYYNNETFVLTTKDDYDRYAVGDWFNGTILIRCI